MTRTPDNFKRLHDGEESVRKQSLEALDQADDLFLHLDVVEKAADSLYHFIHRDEHRDQDDLTIRLLGIRMFNSLNATLKLLLSGYYQAATLQQRDMMENFFLLDYFLTDRAQIARWRQADDKALREEFSPVKVRMALDARDSFTDKKRAAHYKLLSVLAAHPHPRGFKLLELPDRTHQCGPFFDDKWFQTTLSGLGQSAVQAGLIFSGFFRAKSKVDLQMKLKFLEVARLWSEKFHGNDAMDAADLTEMRTTIASLSD